MVDKQNAAVYLHFIRTFDKVFHYIPMTKLEKSCYVQGKLGGLATISCFYTKNVD